MHLNWRKWIPRITWKPESKEIDDLKTTLAEVYLSAEQLLFINRGLNNAIGKLSIDADNLRIESINLLSAITMQHGGEFVIGADFFAALDDPDSPELSLKIERQDDNSVSLKLVPTEEETDGEE